MVMLLAMYVYIVLSMWMNIQTNFILKVHDTDLVDQALIACDDVIDDSLLFSIKLLFLYY